MSLFKTAGSLLLVCTDEPLAELGGQEVPLPWRASRPAKPSCRFARIAALVGNCGHP
jgi:hypothetical protein